jgi:hypothetical protein
MAERLVQFPVGHRCSFLTATKAFHEIDCDGTAFTSANFVCGSHDRLQPCGDRLRSLRLREGFL